MGTVVVGVDGSSCSREALRFAVAEARLPKAALRVVTAWHVPAIAYSGGFAPVVDPKEFEQYAETVAEQALAALREQTEGVDVERVTGEAQAAHVLLEEAETPTSWSSAHADVEVSRVSCSAR